MVKSNYFFILGSLLVSCAVLFSGCEKSEGCTDPTAENFDPSAEIENSTCITQRQKFKGLFDSQELCNLTGAHTFFSEVRASNDNLTDILIFNFANTFVNPVRATINRTTFVIDRQDPDGIGLYVSGNGSIAGNTVTIQYRIRLGGASENICIVNMTK